MNVTKTTVIAHNPFIIEREVLHNVTHTAEDIEATEFFDPKSFQLRLRVAKVINVMAVATWLLGVLLYFI